MSKVLLQDLIISLFELYSPDTSISASDLVSLLDKLDVGQGAARSSISRLKNKNILERIASTHGPEYALHSEARALQHRYAQRVFNPERSSIGDPWALVIFSVPEPKRQHRYALKRELSDLGFGFVGPAVAIAPHSALDEALIRLEQHHLLQYVTYFTADYGAADDLPRKVAEWWDLPALEKQYQTFIGHYEPLLASLDAAGSNQAAALRKNESFAMYVRLYTRWKFFPYHDPNIPLPLLPADWPAPKAKAIFYKLHDLLADRAHDAAQNVLARH